MTTRPTILFACIHNSGRSVAGRRLSPGITAGDAVEVRSAGSEPGDRRQPCRRRRCSPSAAWPSTTTCPTLLDLDLVEAADVVVTMGCGETCPVFPGKRYEDWPVDDPAGQDLDTVRAHRRRHRLPGPQPARRDRAVVGWAARV